MRDNSTGPEPISAWAEFICYVLGGIWGFYGIGWVLSCFGWLSDLAVLGIGAVLGAIIGGYMVWDRMKAKSLVLPAMITIAALYSLPALAGDPASAPAAPNHIITWREVEQWPEYKNGDHAQRAAIADAYFHLVVIPLAAPGDLPQLRHDFDKRTGLNDADAPAAPPIVTLGLFIMAGVALALYVARRKVQTLLRTAISGTVLHFHIARRQIYQGFSISGKLRARGSAFLSTSAIITAPFILAAISSLAFLPGHKPSLALALCVGNMGGCFLFSLPFAALIKRKNTLCKIGLWLTIIILGFVPILSGVMEYLTHPAGSLTKDQDTYIHILIIAALFYYPGGFFSILDNPPARRISLAAILAVFLYVPKFIAALIMAYP